MYTHPHQSNAYPLALGYPEDDHEMERARERHWAMRSGRWQGAIAVIAVALFWRFFVLAGIIALAFTIVGGARRRRAHGGQRPGRRWRRRKHRDVARRALTAQPDPFVSIEPDRVREQQAALADFERRLQAASVNV